MGARDFETAYRRSMRGPDLLEGLVPDTSYRDGGMGPRENSPTTFDGSSPDPDGTFDAYDDDLTIRVGADYPEDILLAAVEATAGIEELAGTVTMVHEVAYESVDDRELIDA